MNIWKAEQKAKAAEGGGAGGGAEKKDDGAFKEKTP